MQDLICSSDLDLFGRETTDPLEVLAQDLFHRLTETYGSNPDDVDRGVGIVDALSGIVEDRDIGAEIRADFLKDDRVSDVRVTVTQIPEVAGGQRIATLVQTVDGILPLDVTIVDGVVSRAS